MNEQNQKLLELERRILQDRSALLELTEQGEGLNDALSKEKLISLQRDVSGMMRQLEILRNLSQTSAANAPVVAPNAVAKPADEPVATSNSASVESPEKSGFDPSKIAAAWASTQAPAKQKDFERTVGRSLMGIFASVLIFISIILFATVILPYFGDTAKMITTYVVSAAFLGIGLWKSQKDRENKFYLALTGCGVGALYISLLLSCIYFKAFGEIPLYILLTIWSAGVLYLAKRRGLLFQIIGEAGITISLIFGCFYCVDKDSVDTLFPALLVFCLLSTTMFYLGNYKKYFNGNIIHNVFQIVNLLLLIVIYLFFSNNILSTLLIALLIAVAIAGCFTHANQGGSIPFGIIVAAYISLAMLFIFRQFEPGGELFHWTILAILFIGLLEWKKMERPEGRYLAQLICIVWAYFGLTYNDSLFRFSSLALFAALVLVGYLHKNIALKYSALALFLVSFIHEQSFAHVEVRERLLSTLLGCLLLGGCLFLQWWKKEQYSIVWKYCLHVLALLFITVNVGEIVEKVAYAADEGTFASTLSAGLIAYILYTVMNLGMMKSLFGRNLQTGEPESTIFYSILNSLSMMFGTGLLLSREYEGFELIILIMTVLSAYLINAKNLLDRRENIWYGIYVGAKMTFLSICILHSFHTVNYVISIACLLIAILSIVLGFLGKYKSLRVFGLVLSMISTFKLVMIDISYDNTLGHAASFFISGILCFAISLIYNYIDKKFRDSEANAN